ncbi:MAG: NTP transferase domain-containing protein [Paludibacteraceae bacterium]|nr:NTP transferase domain-containing protein [Paludibacteraceae bacterium]MBO7367081.1 NTP transferase domain-containing protein [Paludibacteraceae bacterium]
MATNNNYCVIMAGGVGARFWPYSRNSRPKQFLDFLGTGRSLLQMTYDRMIKLVPKENILIVTNKSYRDMVLEQLPLVTARQVLLEPARRNTAPCIAYAAARVYAANKNGVMVVVPSDHLITKEDEFVEAAIKGLDFVANHDAILTLGITPSRPETGYGYIQAGQEVENGIRKVKTFTEKPNAELAKVFMDSGEFYWNSGMFFWSVKTIRAAFRKFLPDTFAKFEMGHAFMGTDSEQAFVDEYFPSCQKISIDYGIMEHVTNAHVLFGDFGWSDLGTWGSLHDVLTKDEEGNSKPKGTSLCYDSKDNIVVVPKGKIAVVQGLEGYIVVDTENALLICRKDEEQRIRQFVNDVSLLENGEEFI